MTLPKDVRDQVQSQLWTYAEEVDWNSLSSREKAQYYTQWTDSEAIGGVLTRYMNARVVRVYIKDTLLKGFGREQLVKFQALVLRVVGLRTEDITRTFIKPHGLHFSDGRSVVWGRADDWKTLLGSLFERGHGIEGERVVVLLKASPRFMASTSRELVEDAARRLGISRCVWFD